MTEVLYTIKNGKILDPNIPMDGLVCYLDTRGKKNTDKHRATLLDLSGNGNNGVLQNFAFSESSGYVKDLSGGGNMALNFDGVDDIVMVSKPFTADDFTIFIDLDRDLTNSKEIRFEFILTTDSDYSTMWIQVLRNQCLLQLRLRGQEAYEGKDTTDLKQGRNKLVIRKTGNVADLITPTSTVIFNIAKTLKVDRLNHLRKMSASDSLDIFRNFIFYNRALTDTEINQLLGA